jgi:hypothetical protein
VADQEDWVARLLETSIRSSGLSERELERRLGWKRGALGRALQDGGTLEQQQVLDILEVLQRESAVARALEAPGMVGELLGRFRRLGYEAGESEEPVGAPWHGTELESRVEKILLEAFDSSLLEGREEE